MPIPQSLLTELDRAQRSLADLQAEFAALADPEVVALDDEHDSEGSTIGFERARVAGLIERTQARIAELERATDRAAEGSYGLCDACGSDIGDERLSALPHTRLCIRCARS